MSLFTSKSLREMLKLFTFLHLYKYINKFIHNSCTYYYQSTGLSNDSISQSSEIFVMIFTKRCKGTIFQIYFHTNI